MVYDCIVIGAGVGGLAAATKLSCAGKKVLLLEKQPIPGGFATSFSRKGFTFESALHCVDALAPEQEVRDFLEETGVSKRIDFIPLKDFCRIIYPQHDFTADFNPEHYREFLIENFPQEKRGIEKLFLAVERFSREFNGFANPNLPAWLQLAKSPFFYRSVIRASLLNFSSFLNRYTLDQKLQGILGDICRFIGLPPNQVSCLYFLIVFRGYYLEPTFYVKGGFRRLFQAMIDRIKENGGEVNFNSEVKKITCQKHLKTVITQKGEFQAKAIISNLSPQEAFSNLLDSQIDAQKIAGLEKSLSAFQVYLGLKVSAKSLGMTNFMFSINTSYNHDDNFGYSFSSDYQKCCLKLVDHAQIDPGLVPPGKGSLTIMTLDNYASWVNLGGQDYQQHKVQVAQQLIGRVEKYLPGLTEAIEVMEVATPQTMARFGSSPEGAIYGFSQTIAQAGINRLAQETKIPGLYLAGAWTRPGAGVHACFISGRDAADMVLKFLK